MSPQILAGIGCFARALAFVHSAPIVSEEPCPERARLALAALLGLVLAPAGALPGGSLIGVVVAEALAGGLMGLALTMPWATIGALLPQLAAAGGIDTEDEGEPISARLSAAAGLACFLALGGERFLLTMLAAPRYMPLRGEGFAELALHAGAAVLALAAEGIVPFLAVLAAAKIGAALVSRAAAWDLGALQPPVMTGAAVALVVVFLNAAPLLYENALHESAALADSAGKRPVGGEAR